MSDPMLDVPAPPRRPSRASKVVPWLILLVLVVVLAVAGAYAREQLIRRVVEETLDQVIEDTLDARPTPTVTVTEWAS